MSNPQFPLYIPTKKRAESRFTSRALDFMRVSHYLVVEDTDYDDYARSIHDWETETGLKSSAKIIVLDQQYKRDYELLDDLGLTRSTGPGPARNFAWDHSISNGHSWHWVMDDNIKNFLRLNNNLKIKMADGTCFRVMEDFVLRYSNVTMAGPNYRSFASQNAAMPPYVKNTRIYSCNLIKNSTPFRWRGRYNEDTILSLDMLTAGLCTVQFNAFLQDKMRTQLLGGGNSAEFYFDEGTAPKSRMLKDVYPEYTDLVWKFGREHHHVNYIPFKRNLLKRIDGYKVDNKINNYGMKLDTISPDTPGRI
tara:strand:+ start:1201 stop:2121 length:921 start_codon:yes stop_codon:yes gene_type:complete